ncbi:hypothetical protein J2S01_000194 [Pectinatus haikarae]|uniref:Uncharacterized protein n=1 Tax=Pectinatus haikarae TaxID=349096 RepID=A0ABT9Y436_9FIRM|nr:hypothetical protein [Pectinatus haikarae]
MKRIGYSKPIKAGELRELLKKNLPSTVLKLILMKKLVRT